MQSITARIRAKTDVRGADECWPWRGAKNDSGYGYIHFEGKSAKVHRIILVLQGALPRDGEEVLHACDRRDCVNPAHLRFGTHADNMQEMVDRKRSLAFAGENSPNAKLTNADVLAIRRSSGPQRVIASRYGISGMLVSKIRSRKAWKHI